MLKKILALSLSAFLLLGLLTACGVSSLTEPELFTFSTETETNAETKTDKEKEFDEEKEAKVMKILTLGSSSSVDSNHMLNLVAHREGFDQDLVIGTLYYSGCKLSQHVQFLTKNSNVYSLYLSSTKTPNSPPKIEKNITMGEALRYDNWDIIFLQAGGSESMSDSAFTNGNITIIRKYVEANRRNPSAVYGWHAIGVSSTDPELIATYPYSPNPYATSAEKFNYDRNLMLTERTSRLERYIMSDPTYEYVIPSCTAIENAITSCLGQKGIKRDYTHLTDVGRLVASYFWYAKLSGIKQLDQIQLDAIPKAFLKSTTDKTQDRPLTDTEKAVILESVNNALKNPLEITQSQIITN